MITEQQMRAIAEKLDPRDFSGFAEKVSEIDPVQGAVVMWHAEPGDYDVLGNSPDLLDNWCHPEPAVEGMSPVEAVAWCYRWFGECDPDEASVFARQFAEKHDLPQDLEQE